MVKPRKIQVDPNQPTWVCYDCGKNYGSFKAGTATWHSDTCGVCGRYRACTEPRDFGYLLLGWKNKKEREDDGKHDDEDRAA